MRKQGLREERERVRERGNEEMFVKGGLGNKLKW